MKLDDMASKPNHKRINKIIESRFGFKIDYDSITLPKATRMSTQIMETVSRIRKSSAIHTAERDPKYLEMLVVYEGLQRWIEGYRVNSYKRKLREGEMGKSEAILAAKDMVDSVQDMIEKIGKMQNEQLPALVDSIRDQIGMEQADAFKNSAGTTLTGLIAQLGQAREQMDSGARGLTGESMPTAMGMPNGSEVPGGMGEEPMDMGGDNGGGIPDEDTFGMTDAASGPDQMGRERR